MNADTQVINMKLKYIQSEIYCIIETSPKSVHYFLVLFGNPKQPYIFTRLVNESFNFNLLIYEIQKGMFH